MPWCCVTVLKSATWSQCPESIFYFKCNHLIEVNHQTRPISCRLHSLANLVNLGNFGFFFLCTERIVSLEVICTGSSGVSEECSEWALVDFDQ